MEWIDKDLFSIIKDWQRKCEIGTDNAGEKTRYIANKLILGKNQDKRTYVRLGKQNRSRGLSEGRKTVHVNVRLKSGRQVESRAKVLSPRSLESGSAKFLSHEWKRLPQLHIRHLRGDGNADDGGKIVDRDKSKNEDEHEDKEDGSGEDDGIIAMTSKKGESEFPSWRKVRFCAISFSPIRIRLMRSFLARGVADFAGGSFIPSSCSSSAAPTSPVEGAHRIRPSSHRRERS